MSRTIDEIDAELRVVNDELNALYWTYTRTARGKPPCVVRPDLYRRRADLMRERRATNKDR